MDLLARSVSTEARLVVSSGGRLAFGPPGPLGPGVIDEERWPSVDDCRLLLVSATDNGFCSRVSAEATEACQASVLCVVEKTCIL